MEFDSNFATKYRPKSYSEVVGQEVPKEVLRKIAHFDGIACRSIFLHGLWGSGKTTLARIFAASMNCNKFKETNDICGECEGCLETKAANSQIYWEFDATTAGNIDSIRDLHDRLSILPQRGYRRVVVLDEIHACSAAALNALLKLVEEGIPSTIFVFCSTEEILPTLMSRSICLDITTISNNAMSERISYVASQEGIAITSSQIDSICLKSEGHMRDALSLLQLFSMAGDKVLNTPVSLIARFFAAALSRNKEKSVNLIGEILQYPSTEISWAISQFIKESYTSGQGDPYNKFLKAGVLPKIFDYFYSPVAQQALRSEVGIELLLRGFLNRLKVL